MDVTNYLEVLPLNVHQKIIEYIDLNKCWDIFYVGVDVKETYFNDMYKDLSIDDKYFKIHLSSKDKISVVIHFNFIKKEFNNPNLSYRFFKNNRSLFDIMDNINIFHPYQQKIVSYRKIHPNLSEIEPLLNYTEYHLSKDSYKKLLNFFKTQIFCQLCFKNELYERIVPCYSCNKIKYHSKCFSKCYQCNKKGCIDCIVPYQNKYICNDLANCSLTNCQGQICQKVYDEHICEVCLEDGDNEPIVFCDECLNKYFFKCYICQRNVCEFNYEKCNTCDNFICNSQTTLCCYLNNGKTYCNKCI